VERIIVDAVPDTCDQDPSFISTDAQRRQVGERRGSGSAAVFGSIELDRSRTSRVIQDFAANTRRIDSLCHKHYEV